MKTEEIIDLIAGRIIDEQRKHATSIADWNMIAAKKIYSQWFKYLSNENSQLKEQLSKKYECIVNLNTSRNEIVLENEALKEQLAAKEKEWISVEDRLPNNKERVLVFRKKDFDFENEYFITYILNGSFINGLKNITHWMPLPTPQVNDKK